MRSRLASFIAEQNPHLQEVARGAFLTLVLKVVAAAAGLAMSVLLARLLGAETVGLFYLSLTVVTVLAMIGRLGLDNSVLRFIAANAAEQRWGAIKGIYRKSTLTTSLMSSLATILAMVFADTVAEKVFAKPELAVVIRWMSMAIVPLALISIHAHAFQGIRRIREAVTFQSILIPSLAALLLFMLVPSFGVSGAAVSYVVASVAALILAYGRWRRLLLATNDDCGKFNPADLRQSSRPLFVVSLLQLLITSFPTLVLGMYADSASVGVYEVANRTALLISFVLVAVNMTASPKFAVLSQQRDHANLEYVVQSSTRLMLVAALPLLGVFFVFPEAIMSIYGMSFSSGGSLLVILAFGQLVNVAAGSVSYLLMMSGNEHDTRRIIIITAAANALLSFTLVPTHGGMGAAAATATSVIIQNLLGMYYVHRRLGIWTLTFNLRTVAASRTATK